MSDVFLIYSTFGNAEEARIVAKALVKKHLVACVNIVLAIESFYEWEGTLHQENEVLLLAKTQQFRVEETIAFIKSKHSYEVPCITALAVTEGFSPFLHWVETQASQ